MIAGVDIGYPNETSLETKRFPVDETTRWINCDSSWLSAKASPPTYSAHGLFHLVSSRHCSHQLDTARMVPKAGNATKAKKS